MILQWRMMVISLLISSYLFGMEDTNGKMQGKVTGEDCVSCEQIDTCNGQYVSCEKCQEVYYCSLECRQANRNIHQKYCYKLQQAHCGDLASIDCVMRVNLEQLKATNKKKYLNEVLKWHSRNTVRFAQDAYCYVSTKQPEVTKIQKKHLNELCYLIKQGIIQKESIEKAFERMFNSIAWAQKITANESLVDPCGILSLDSQESHDDFFIPKDQWRSQRLKALEEMNGMMEKYSNHAKNGGHLPPYEPDNDIF